MAKKASSRPLRRGEAHLGYVVENAAGEFGVFPLTCLLHDGDFTVSKGLVASAREFADAFIPNGHKYVYDVPHGDQGQGHTWVWLDEVDTSTGVTIG